MVSTPKLPYTIMHDCLVVTIGNPVTVIGGNQGSCITNKIFGLTRENRGSIRTSSIAAAVFVTLVDSIPMKFT